MDDMKALVERTAGSKHRLSMLSGVSYPTIDAMCKGTGNPSLATMQTVASAMGVEVGEVVAAIERSRAGSASE